jgi:hypothetical protein
MVKRPTGTIIAPPQPCKMRHATIRCKLLDTPHKSEPSVNSPIAELNTTRVPKRSATQPLSGMNTAKLSV